MKSDAVYFPHFSNARNDRKIRRVMKELGIEGYGIYFMLLETLREQPEMKYPIGDVDLLADEFGTSEQKVRTVVSNYSLFDIDNKEEFFSPKLIEYLTPMLEKREKNKKAAQIRWDKERAKKGEQEQADNANALQTHNICNTKKRKEKKSKVKQNKEPAFSPHTLKPDAVDEQLWADFLDNRKHKKLQNTERALKVIIKAFEEGIQAGYTYEQMIERYVSSGMQRFKVEWMADNGKQNDKQNNNHLDQYALELLYDSEN